MTTHETPTPDLDRRKTRNKRILAITGTGVLFFIGIGIGGAGANDNEPTTVAETVEVPGPTETVEVPGPTVTEVPAVCLDALDDADAVFRDLGPIFSDTVILAVDSAFYGDTAGLEQATDELDAFNSRLEASTYRANADQCIMEAGE